MHSKAYITMTSALGLKCGAIRKGVTPMRVLEYIFQDMTRLKADNILTTDPEAVAHLAGMWEAYRNVAHYIAPLTEIKSGYDAVPPGVSAASQLVNAVKH